jgi:hypothetical protein
LTIVSNSASLELGSRTAAIVALQSSGGRGFERLLSSSVSESEMLSARPRPRALLSLLGDIDAVNVGLRIVANATLRYLDPVALTVFQDDGDADEIDVADAVDVDVDVDVDADADADANVVDDKSFVQLEVSTNLLPLPLESRSFFRRRRFDDSGVIELEALLL